ncbi:MAG TPA: NAD(P)-binding protein [Propionibacteriaceae bacterium]|nr:NAD(P)-binding protein [Propionibacteriaceae bacterium]
MRISVIGAGPTGLFLAATLALREHHVTVVDRDPGPTPDGVWRRRGVMQFHHAHLFRPQCAETLQVQLMRPRRCLSGTPGDGALPPHASEMS